MIVTQDGFVDLPWDRTDAEGPERQWLFEMLETRYPLSKLHAELGEKLTAGLIGTREAGVWILYEDDELTVAGDTKGSGGYFYVAAWLKPNPPTKEADDGVREDHEPEPF
jgi:hypothetical protein